jgi:predicted AAA+ superfamily ATPase
MKRAILKDLIAWKERKGRMPLLLRGPRQVGKTYIVDVFGKQYFEDYVSINFELRPDCAKAFEDLDPRAIIGSLELIMGRRITSGKTLLFLDEIQSCPKAIVSLRYFREQMPELHVIGAGSLLEFAFHDQSFQMPVGRVEFLFLRPLSFLEYLEAANESLLLEKLVVADLESPLPVVAHERLMKLTKEYLHLGGMPAVLSEYFDSKSLYRCQELQFAILYNFRNDFGKYAKLAQHKNLQLLFERAPGLIGQWFKYSKVDPDVQSRDLKVSIEQLSDAGLIVQVFATAASGIPLIAQANLKKFKLLFLDVGLAKRAMNLDLALLFEENLMLVNQGALAEQFVGQELLSLASSHEMTRLFFWIREETGSSAEVDYIFNIGAKIIPIEVKSGASGKMKSLTIFMKEKKSEVGIQISQAPLSYQDKILTIPFYMISQIPRLIKNL